MHVFTQHTHTHPKPQTQENARMALPSAHAATLKNVAGKSTVQVKKSNVEWKEEGGGAERILFHYHVAHSPTQPTYPYLPHLQRKLCLHLPHPRVHKRHEKNQNDL